MRKKLIFLLFAFLALAWQTNAQCDYTLEMNDSYGDGWNGNTMDVLVNGNVVLDDVTLDDGSQGTLQFQVNTGDDVTTVWNGGGNYGDETSYRILDVDGNEVGSGAESNIDSGTITANCPSCLPPTDLVFSNPTQNTINLSWTDNNSGNSTYLVEWREAGSSTWTSDTTGTGDTSYQISGLNAKTEYEWQLSADCGGDGTSSVVIGDNFYTAGSCGVYKVSLIDSYGDGWNGGSLDVYVNGTLFLDDLTLDDGSGPKDAFIPVDINDIISFDYTAGSYSGENQYIVYDSNDNEVGNEGDGDTPNDLGDPSIPNGIQACPTCASATDLAVNNITYNSAELTWTDNAGGASYIVNWKEASASSWNTDTTAAGATSYTLTGLNGNTNYEWQLTTDCGNGDNSQTLSAPGFITPCAPVANFPYNYGFEDVSSSDNADWSASCWSANPENTSSQYRWNSDDAGTPSSDTGPSAANSGTQYAFTEASNGSQGDTAELYTVEFDLTPLNNPQLSFFYHMYGADMGELHVDTYDGSAWTNDVWSISGQQQTATDDPWTKVEVSIPTSVTQIRFRAVRGSGYQSDMAIDDIAVEEAPTCLIPTDLAYANISGGEVDLSWTDNNTTAPSNGWEYEVIDVTAGETFTGVGTTVTSATAHVTGLTVDDQYKFKVRALCDSSTESDWSAEFSWYQTEVPGCASNPTPADGATEITAGYEYISWDAPTTGGTVSSYEVYFGTDANNLIDVGSLTDTFIDANSLQANTTYYWKIVPKNANDEEATGCPVWSFTTQVPPPAPQGVSCNSGYPGAIFTEEFDDQGDWTGDIENSNLKWHFGKTGGTGSSETGPNGAFSGDKYMYFEASSPSQGTTASAVSPAIDLTNHSVAELSFYMHAYGAGMGDLNVGIGTDPAGPFTNIFTYGALQNANDEAWVPVGIDISAYAGQVIYLQFTEESTGDYHGDMAIDKLIVTSCVACPEPSDLLVDDLTGSSAVVSWTDNTGGNEPYYVRWHEIGNNTWYGSGVLPVGVTSYEINGLTEKTHYEWKVFTDCSANGNGVTGPVFGPEFYTWYCESVPTSNDGSGITQVELGNEVYTVPDVQYEDFTDQNVANLTRGELAHLLIDFATGYTYDTNVWIDFNKNYVFDADELVFDGVSTSDNPTTLDASFNLDAIVPTGDFIMRIGTADSGQSTPNPCYSGSWGVTLDFKINIVCPAVDSFPYEYGFEDMVSGFVSDWSSSCWSTDPANVGVGINEGPYRWLATAGTTPSGGTGPMNAHSGNLYAFTEASGNEQMGDEASIISPDFDMSNLNDPMISFYYYMYSYDDIGSLHLDTYDGSSWTNDVWSITGTQQQSANEDWNLVEVNVPNTVTKFRLRAVRGDSFRGDIAVDDIRVSETCYSPEALSVDDVMDITATVSWTDTSNSSAEYYIEWRELGASSWNQDVSAAGSTSFTFTGLNPSTEYEWRMHSTCGNYFSEIVPGENFTTLCGAIASFPYDYGFEDMYPDYISDWSASCWNVTPDMAGTGPNSAPFRWLTASGTTPSGGTGPASADEGNIYAYTEASGASYAGDETELYSPLFDMSNLSTPTISFSYFMFGNNMGELHVDTYDGSTWTNDVFVVSGQQQTSDEDVWLSADVSLDSSVVQIRFRGVRGDGFRSDIAIDNISIYDNAPNMANPYTNSGDENYGRTHENFSDTNMVNIYQKDGIFNLKSMDEHNITGVQVFDLSGRLLFNNNSYNERLVQVELHNVATGNLLIFVVQLDNGNSLTKKAIK